jgi:CHAT domain-containing protein
MYGGGRVLDAVAALDETEAQTSDQQEKLRLLDLEMDVCSSAYYYACLVSRGPKFIHLVTSLQLKGAPFAKAIYVATLERFLARDLGSIEKGPGFDFASKFADPIRSPDVAINLYGLSAQIAQFRGRFPDSAEAISLDLATMLGVRANNRLFVARTLASLIPLLLSNENPVKAIRWMDLTDNFIRSALGPKSPDRAFYLLSLLELYESLPLSAKTFHAVADARAAIAELQIDPTQKQMLLSDVSGFEVGADLLMGNLDAARDSLHTNPLSSSRAAIIQQGQFTTPQALVFALEEVILDTLSNRQPDPGWLTAFTGLPKWVMGSSEEEEVNALRRFGRSILLLKTQSNGSRAEALAESRAAAKAHLELRRRNLRIGDSFPLPKFVDRLLLGEAIAAGPPSDIDGDLLIRGAELLNRNITYTGGDALAIIGNQQDDESRALVHSLLRLSDQQSQWEAAQISRLVEELSAGKPNQLQQDQSTNASNYLLTLTNFIRARRMVSDELIKRTGSAGDFVSLPSLHEIQQVLRQNEVFVMYAPASYPPIKICVRQNGFWTSPIQIDGATYIKDVKLLSLALTAVNPPSDELDQQYPVQEALRLYHDLFDGFGQCLRPGDHVIFIPPGDFRTVPLSALLTDLPAKEGNGYDLRHAHWFVIEHPISYAASAQAFASARALSGRATGDREFLGVGDPNLRGVMADGATGGQALARRGAAVVKGILSELDPLPDTRTELISISKTLGTKKSELLLADDATEENFLSRPLDRYSILHFATHGLIRSDLPGLTEMALVLSPVDEDDSFNDGLLTASKIANLNLRAKLVVLSACNSANFDLTYFGSQVQGLTTAFSVAGVPTVVASLWPVESGTTQRIMTSFYNNLKQDNSASADTALANAIKQTILNAPSTAYAHPRFWAPFLIYGDGGVTLASQSIAAQAADTVTEMVPSGGEIVGSAAMDEGFATSEVGPIIGNRHTSLIKGRTPAGAVAWSVEDREIGAGPIARSGAIVFAGGSRWDGRRERSIPVIRAFDNAGKLLWKLEPSLPYDSSNILSLASLADGGLVALIAPFSTLNEPHNVTLLDVSQTGVEVGRNTYSVPEMVDGFAINGRGTLAVQDSKIYMSINTGRLLWNGLVRNELGFPQTC